MVTVTVTVPLETPTQEVEVAVPVLVKPVPLNMVMFRVPVQPLASVITMACDPEANPVNTPVG